MITIADYQIKEKIYSGAFTDIYRADSEKYGGSVIIKILNSEYPTPKESARLKHEFEILKRLQGIPGVIKVHDIERVGARHALIMEDFPGLTIKETLASKKMGIKEFLSTGTQIAQILGEVHNRQVIHKDINPQNMLVNPETGEVRVIDFGISSLLTHENQQLSSPGLLEGTLQYISPEQTGRMNRQIDYRTDFYSLGVTFYEMLTGSVPFKVTDPMELIHCHIAKNPPSPHSLDHTNPKAVSDIVMKLLSKTSEERYKSAFGLLADLKESLAQFEKAGRIELVPGQNDVSDKFGIPQKLYGRKEQTELLMEAFERVSHGQTEMMLVAGYSGIGKSALIHEIHKPMTQRRGYFISGKFDLLTRSNPYQAVIRAFQDLIRQILTESEDNVEVWKSLMLKALGPNGQVVTDVIPEVELLIGKQPPLPFLPPTESQNRFNFVFRDFVGVLAQRDHPLVMFLDDLQWADAASLNLMQILLTDSNIKYLFFIGSYRDNEVDGAHPLMLMLKEIKLAKTPMSTVHLPTLSEEQLNHLIADTLNCPKDRIADLGVLVLKKTNGNPFFVNEFLKALYQNQLIAFDGTRRQWTWDLKKIEEKDITDNVVEFMTAKIQRLRPQAQEILKLAACLGNRFNLKTLAIVNVKSEAKTAEELWQAVQEELIIPIGESAAYLQALIFEAEPSSEYTDLAMTFKFLHDRVQQAAYTLLSEDEKKEVHLRIGRLLLDVTSDEQLEEKIFDIVDQLNVGRSLIKDPEEFRRLAQLNLTAGHRAKSSRAYGPALGYLRVGKEVLPENSWQTAYPLTRKLYMELAECEYLNTHFDDAEKTFDIVLQNVQSKLDKVEIYNIKVVLYISKTKSTEALKIGREGLRLLGASLPESNFVLHILMQSILARWNLGKRKIEDLQHSPEITDPYKLAMLKLLMSLSPAAYYTDPTLVMLIGLKMTNLSLRYGNTNVTSYAYLLYGVVLINVFGRAQSGYLFGRLALQLNEKYNNLELKSRLHMIFGAFVSSWVKHIDESIKYYHQGYKDGIESGDFMYAGYCSYGIPFRLLLRGEHLDDVVEAGENSLRFLTKSRQPMGTHMVIPVIRLALNLKGLTKERGTYSDEKFEEEKFLEEIAGPDFQTLLYSYYTTKIQSLVFFKYYQKAYNLALPLLKNVDRVLYGGFALLDFYYHFSLVVSSLYETANSAEQHRMEKILRRALKKMKKWATDAPENFMDKYLLMQAEWHRIQKNYVKAIQLYQQAIDTAEKNRFMHSQAVCCEMAAVFYQNLGADVSAMGYLIKAKYLYSKWGATEKVKAMEEEYKELFSALEVLRPSKQATIEVTSTSTETDMSTRLDLHAIMQVSSTISGETVLAALLEKIMRVAVQNAGAQRGYLILERGGELLIEAEGQAGGEDGETVKVLQSVPVAREAGKICQAVLQYVKRTQEHVVLDNAMQQGMFVKDPYVKEHQSKSLLCSPITSQGKLRGMLYLENNLSVGAFTAERLKVLSLLSSQAALAIGQAEAMIDGLTRLWVRKHFMERAEQELQTAVESSQNCVVFMMDLDHFKEKNDRYGHQVGDLVLREVADRVKVVLRDRDCLGRYGGEEFILLLPDTGLVEAKKVGNRILEAVRGTPIGPDGQKFQQTVSVGLAVYPEDGRTLDELIKQADEALYKAKRGGRNQLCR